MNRYGGSKVKDLFDNSNDPCYKIPSLTDIKGKEARITRNQ